MSRLSNLSPAALRALFSPDADDTFIILLTLSGANLPAPLRLCDNYTGRISETEEDIVYGVTSRGNDFMFLPLQINLPSEEVTGPPRARVSISDVTRLLTPHVRQLIGSPNVMMELVLKSSPDAVEISFAGLSMSSISYNANTLSADLGMENLALEPFPCHSFTPAYFPGLF